MKPGAMPRYQQISQSIRDMIRDGTLTDGQVLPSTRALAAQWQVSTATIVEAMRELTAEGTVVGRARSRRSVRTPPAQAPPTDPGRLDMVCLCCAATLAPVLRPARDLPQPQGGIILRSNGNFGSTVFDDVGRLGYLVAFLCDGCVVVKAPVLGYVREQPQPPVVHVRPFADTDYL